MILSAVMLAVTLTFTSIKIIQDGKKFTRLILEENRTFLINTLRLGHIVMSHMGSENLEKLINLAMTSKFINYLALLDNKGHIIVQSSQSCDLSALKDFDFGLLKDGKILAETKNILLIFYRAINKEQDRKNRKHPATIKGHSHIPPEIGWFLVGLNLTAFKKHHHDMISQTLVSGAAFFLFSVLIIIFFGITQRYELASSSIERLTKIKRLLGHFVPEAAKRIIEKNPDKMGLLNKYIQDATILFLDIEGFTLLQQKYSQENINRAIESYFSTFLDIIQKNGGDINETAGDGMMVIFLHADPVRHARNAIQAALQIQQHSMVLPAKDGSDLFPVRINIGISSGKVYLGSTKMSGAATERWTFTASGATTILAARLAEHAQKGQILIGEETARRINWMSSLRSLGKISLKNLKDSGEVFELLFSSHDESQSNPAHHHQPPTTI
jgi:class 3 adenylate cyclase